ncbi:hypothetical protein IU479_19375 [Nocardia abscessus]|uniref:hypothetical protein n=1 Tax=Nocardia TaxID=1817 RepID=UPI001895FC4B|nr:MULTISPECIES: hypothetical protein [Nocardia]MBF6220268.1 hypothetical protein [Nocardia abscessus]
MGRRTGKFLQSIKPGNDSAAITYLEYRSGKHIGWSCGRSDSVIAATLAAVVRAAGRAARR